jgi:hypothetical protein
VLGAKRQWVADFARLVHPKDGHAKLIAMLQAYFDESGIQDGARVCLVCGYFGGPGQWRRFGAAWQQVLDEYGVLEFHAWQFWAFNDDGKRIGPYKGWDEQKADEFLGKLKEIIVGFREKVHPIGTAVVVDAFNKLSHNQRRYLTGAVIQRGRFTRSGAPTKPYFIAFQFCCIKAAGHASVGGKVHVVFDLNKHFKAYALEVYEVLKSTIKLKDRLGDITFPTGQEAVQLQAADLLCYLAYQFCRKRITDKNAKPEGILAAILQGLVVTNDFSFLDDEGFATVLSGAEIPLDLGPAL